MISRPVVQALPNPANGRLKEALGRLARNPRDVEALMDAGDAAHAIGDFDAAIGFYRRADEISPNNARIKAGFARAYAMNGDPVSAIPYFDAAEKAGAAPAQIAADRGLAYDLVGDNTTAQRYYATAMAAGATDELRMRLALSEAMGGNQKASEATLLPLLRKQDKPGWRTRAFALAIGGDIAQAVSVAQSILPAPLAENIAPYLRYMPRLTRAQQAAAANLGRFPRASEIGRDDSRIAAYAPPRLATADSVLVPKGAPLDGGHGVKTPKSGKTAGPAIPGSTPNVAAEAKRSESVRKAALASANTDRTAPPEPRPAIESTGELPPVTHTAAPLASAKSQPGNVPPAIPLKVNTPPERSSMSSSSSALAQENTPVASSATPGFDLARLQDRSASASAPTMSSPSGITPVPALPSAGQKPPEMTSAAAQPAQPASRPSLTEIFAELGKPTLQASPAAGAVDIRKIAPARPEPKLDPKVEVKAQDKAKPKKPVPPAHPSRIWVQVGVGRDKDAIAFDWRRYAKQAPALFKSRQAYISEMGRTNRILAGPFETQKAANEFVTALKKAGFDSALPWTSPAGQVVDELSVK